MSRLVHRGLTAARTASAALLLVGLATGAAAQTIQSDGAGQPRTFEFTSAGKIVEAGDKSARRSGGRRAARSGPELPRGPKNIPWDEPGKVSGVPGVLDNPATDLPQRSARPRRQHAVRSPAAEPHEAPASPAQAAVPHSAAQKDAGTATPVVTQSLPRRDPDGPAVSSSATEESVKAAAEEAEARARVIERLKAAALAEEQRRLEAEKSRDRFRRGSGPRPSDLSQASAPQRAPEPDHTGTVAAAPEIAPAAKTGGWVDRVCRLILFGGC